MKKTLISWSSGKDSAWALSRLRGSTTHEVAGLFSVISESGAIPMHATPTALLEAQAARTGFPLLKINIPSPCPDAEYKEIMQAFIDSVREEGISAIAFGDLFLEDIRNFRETHLAGTGIEPIFPLWGSDTARLAEEMTAGGLKAIVTSIDTNILPSDFIGRGWGEEFLRDLPAGVDPCGERGEFHTFVFDGPAFSEPLKVAVKDVNEANGFAHATLKLI
jgi:uncharacterized protein (TIGR00290 family)